eukprot:3055230-Amphidinium_carterae.1
MESHYPYRADHACTDLVHGPMKAKTLLKEKTRTTAQSSFGLFQDSSSGCAPSKRAHVQFVQSCQDLESGAAEKKGSKGSTCGALCSLIISVPSLVGGLESCHD